MSGQVSNPGGTMLSRPLAVLDSALQWLIRLVWLNLWWTALTLLGGVVLGIGPATAAGHAVVRRWVKGETDLSVPRTMWAEWRHDWGRRVLVSLIGIGLAVSLGLTWWSSRQLAVIPAAVTQALTSVGLLLTAATLPHLAWVTERTSLNTGRTVLAALAASLRRPVLTVVLLAIGVGWPALLVLSGWPGLLPLCGVSVPLLAGAWCIERVYPSTPPQQDDSPTDEALSASDVHHRKD